MEKDKHGNEIYLPNRTRPSHTGMGLTKSQIEYFKTPRDGAQIAKDLFDGDMWAANHFTNKYYGNGVLRLHDTGQFSLIEW